MLKQVHKTLIRSPYAIFMKTLLKTVLPERKSNMSEKLYQRIIQWLRDRKIVSIGIKPSGGGGPVIEHIIIKNGGHTETHVFGWTCYGKKYEPKDGHKPITIIDIIDQS